MKTKSQPFEELGSRSGSVTSTASARSPGLARINFARRRVNRAVDTVTLLGLLRRRSPRFFELAEVVGRWVWIQFGHLPHGSGQGELAWMFPGTCN